MSATSEPAGRRGRTLVLGLGNAFRGDDGVGPAVVQELNRRVLSPGETDFLDGGTPGLETALLLEGYGRAIIVDAAELGRRPGEWSRLEFGGGAEPPGDLPGATSLHQAGLAEALILGSTLKILPERLTIYGVQPLECGWSPGLSDPVRAAVTEVCRAIGDDLGSPEAAGGAC
jgi:hydrogenase maturation protease